MKFSARVLLQIPHQNPCNYSGCTNPTDGRADSTSQCCFYVLCAKYYECHTQVLMQLNKLNVLPFGSNIYPKRKGRMTGNYSGEWRQSSLCFVTYCALTVWRIARSKCLQIIVSCVNLLTAVEGKLVFWDITPCSRARLYLASRRSMRPSSTVICLECRGRMFLRNIGIY
jgi:hypothetical protein